MSKIKTPLLIISIILFILSILFLSLFFYYKNKSKIQDDPDYKTSLYFLYTFIGLFVVGIITILSYVVVKGKEDSKTNIQISLANRVLSDIKNKQPEEIITENCKEMFGKVGKEDLEEFERMVKEKPIYESLNTCKIGASGITGKW